MTDTIDALLREHAAAHHAEDAVIDPGERITYGELDSATEELGAAFMAAGIGKGSQTPGREGAGSVTAAKVREIAEIKMPDLNANDLEAAKLQVAGTARSMGIEGA